MNTQHYFRYGLAALLLSMTPAAHSEAGTLSLAEAVQGTIARSRAMQASAQDISAAEAMTRVARAGNRPQIDFQYSLNISDDPLDAFAEKLRTRSVVTEDFAPDSLNDPSTSTLFAGGIAMKYSLYNGGLTSARIDRALQHEDAARSRHTRTVQALVFDTIRAYYTAQAAEQGLVIARDAETAAQKHAKTTRELVRDHRTVQSDQLTARVNLSTFTSLRTQAGTRLKLAYNKLKLAMDMPQTETIKVPPLTPQVDLPRIMEVEQLEQRALTQREDLKSLHAALNAAQSAVDAARAANGFQLDLMADTYLYSDDPAVNENAWRVFGVVRKDLYNGGRIKGKVDAALSRVETLRLQREVLTQQIRAEVRAAYDQLQDAASRLQIAAGNVAVARKNVRLITERYGQGRTILIDLLQAERALVEARNEELSAAQALFTSSTALRLAEGTLDPASPDSYLVVSQ